MANIQTPKILGAYLVSPVSPPENTGYISSISWQNARMNKYGRYVDSENTVCISSVTSIASRKYCVLLQYFPAKYWDTRVAQHVRRKELGIHTPVSPACILQDTRQLPRNYRYDTGVTQQSPIVQMHAIC